MKNLRQAFPLTSIFLIVFAANFINDNITWGDARWPVLTALSIIREADTDLDEYPNVLIENDYYSVQKIDGHYYDYRPIGVAIVALPFVAGFDLFFERLLPGLPLIPDYIRSRSARPPEMINVVTAQVGIQLFVACFVVALTAAFIYLIAGLFLKKKYCLLLTFIFAFCTSAWSTASRALWPHGPSMLMLTIALYLILLARDKPWLVQFVSIPLAFSFVIRPTNAVSILLLTGFVFFQFREFFLRYLLWSTTVAIPFFLYSFNVYGELLPPYYNHARLALHPDFFEALAGNLISPSRGVFVFTSIFFFSVAGVVIKLRERQFNRLDFCLLSIILIHWIAISSFPFWWAGRSFGPRFFSDMAPYFVYFLIPSVTYVFGAATKKPLWRGIFFLFVTVSFFIHFRGAATSGPWEWNRHPGDVGVSPVRLWDWTDLQFLRGIF